MPLAPVRCRVLLHSLLPTDDARSSSSLSTTVIKFSIFSDPTRKHDIVTCQRLVWILSDASDSVDYEENPEVCGDVTALDRNSSQPL